MAAATAIPIAAQADTGSSGGGACTWATEMSPRTLDRINVAYPDTNAWYWIMPYDIGPDTTLTIKGRFPDARYISFNTYDSNRANFTNGAASALADYRITPDAGSVNPWQQTSAPGGDYTITVRPDTHASDPNVLPLAPAGVTSGKGYLIYRMYMPAQTPDSSSLPQVTVTTKGVAHTYGSCVENSGGLRTQLLRGIQTLAEFVPGKMPSGTDFVRVAGAGAFPNGDNAYLVAGATRPADGKVVVVHAKAPTVPAGSSPSVWPRPGTDVRYFSLCNNESSVLGPVVYNPQPVGTADTGCRADSETRLDTAGFYTYVIADESQRAAVEAIPGATFVPWSAQHPGSTHILMLRNMLPADGFDSAIQRVAPGASAADTAARLGEYYPRSTVCDLNAVTTGTCA
ncbi:hypothetical protein KHQ06_25355 [Nocardia tengchongensis]|uniref:Uncharacterized protein n=1 Tax=Nocardia tengchongensis TaxID=2055889 RepID=A0ABX8CIB6_9NOCA|nr:hypothetical protein [Nocardia tengchongensis]QVI19670.1 hypothetical protein KHQ06_25355 [Nocardia tengchongensis]